MAHRLLIADDNSVQIYERGGKALTGDWRLIKKSYFVIEVASESEHRFYSVRERISGSDYRVTLTNALPTSKAIFDEAHKVDPVQLLLDLDANELESYGDRDC